MLSRIGVGVLAALLCAAPVAGQQPSTVRVQDRLIRVYLDCNQCDNDYLVENVGFIDYVRDRADADLHVLVTTQGTGGGGTEWTLRFIGGQRFEGHDRTLVFNTEQTATDDERRKEFARVFKLGLVGYAAETPAAPQLDVTWKRPEGSQTGRNDPWNFWVFRLNAGGNFNGEESSNNQSYRLSLSANRTTANWKIEFEAGGNYNTNSFNLDDGRIVESLSRSWNVNSLVVKSVTPRWSSGVRSNLSHSSFSNNERTLRVAPAIEYNIFPYSESTRRSLRVQYSAGVNLEDYSELTIFDKLEDTVPNHAVNIALGLRQPWGSVGASGELSQHLNHLERRRAAVFGESDVRLFRGFSFNFFGRYERISDQISLRKSVASTEEVLLRVQQLATGYSYFFNFGISYRFGSIYNNVVNPRFGG